MYRASKYSQFLSSATPLKAYPFGSALPGRTWSDAGRIYRYGFNGKEKEAETAKDNYDFGARIYDGRLGRWLSVDPVSNLYSGITPFNYCSNSPIARIDFGGEWDIDIHLFNDRAKFGYGILILRNKKGKEILRFVVRAQGMKHRDNGGNPRNRMKRFSDSPTGIYKFERWRNDGDESIYGPYHRLDMVGIDGEILFSHRTEIQIHGGRQRGKYKGQKLWNTGGCFRIADDDIKILKLKCDGLQIDIEETKSRLIKVSNDLEFDSETEAYFIPSELSSLNNKRNDIILLRDKIEKQQLDLQNTKRSDYNSEMEFNQAVENKQSNLQSMETELKNLENEKVELEKKGIKGDYYGKSS